MPIQHILRDIDQRAARLEARKHLLPRPRLGLGLGRISTIARIRSISTLRSAGMRLSRWMSRYMDWTRALHQ